MFQYLYQYLLAHSSIWDVKYIFSEFLTLLYQVSKKKMEPLFASFFSTKESKMGKKLPTWANLRMLAWRWWKVDEIW